MGSLQRPSRPALILLACFALISLLVATGVTLPWDDAALRVVGGWRQPALTNLMLAATFAGNGDVELPLALGIVLLLWRLGQAALAQRYLMVALSGELLYVVLKASFHRPRPSIIPRLGEAGWYSYPSGHSMMAPVIWTFGLLLLARLVPFRVGRAALVGLGLVAPLAIAVSRVYLGVHYPSDVVGALLIGSAWVIWWWPPSVDPSSNASTSSAPAIR
jgi:undecaprenyl-diphosphatase